MNINSFVVGGLVGAVAVAIVLSKSERTDSVSTTVSQLVSQVTSKLSSDAAPAAPAVEREPLFRINGPTEIPLRAPVQLRMPYGKVTIGAGTRVLALRETDHGVLAKFGGRDVLLPAASFRPRAPVVEAAPPAATPSAPTLPTPPPPTPPAATAPVSPPAPDSEIGLGSFSKFLLVVDGDESKGSASVISIRGQPLIVTNAHVLSGNKTVKFRRLNSKELPFEKIGISKDYDLAVATQKDITEGLPILEDVANNVLVGDAVLVLGNSLGSDVVTEIPGKVTGVGPDLIEVDAKFVHGNSGSPIVHLKTGKVLAIATFATARKLSSLDKDSTFDEIRRFGFRLDTANAWEYPSWNQLVGEGETLKRIRHVTDALLAVALDIFDDGYLSLDPHQAPDNPVRPYVTEYLQAMHRRKTASDADILNAKQKLFRNLIYVSKKDIGDLDLTNFTAWHRNRGKEELKNREFLRDKFIELANRQDADQRIRLP